MSRPTNDQLSKMAENILINAIGASILRTSYYSELLSAIIEAYETGWKLRGIVDMKTINDLNLDYEVKTGVAEAFKEAIEAIQLNDKP